MHKSDSKHEEEKVPTSHHGRISYKIVEEKKKTFSV
jgi:hypothetical protein